MLDSSHFLFAHDFCDSIFNPNSLAMKFALVFLVALLTLCALAYLTDARAINEVRPALCPGQCPHSPHVILLIRAMCLSFSYVEALLLMNSCERDSLSQ